MQGQGMGEVNTDIYEEEADIKGLILSLSNYNCDKFHGGEAQEWGLV